MIPGCLCNDSKVTRYDGLCSSKKVQSHWEYFVLSLWRSDSGCLCIAILKSESVASNFSVLYEALFLYVIIYKFHSQKCL